MEVVLYGEGQEKHFFNQMARALQLRYKTSVFGEHIALFEKNKACITIFESKGKLDVNSDNSLVVLRENADIKNLNLISPNIPVLVCSDNKRQIAELSKKGYRAVSCGLLEKDTLNFSSLGEEFSMVALQRKIRCFRKYAEPMDIPIKHPADFSPYLLLVLAAVVIFFECPEEPELDFGYS